MNAASLVSFGWALVFAAGCAGLSVQIGHAQSTLPPVTDGQPQASRLVAADRCCHSGVAQMVLMLSAPTTIPVLYGRNLAGMWNDNQLQQNAKMKAKLGLTGHYHPRARSVNPVSSFPLRPRLCDEVRGWISHRRSCEMALSVSVDPRSKLLKVNFRVYDNSIYLGATTRCGTFDLEVAMVFEVTRGVTLRSSNVNSSNFVPTGACGSSAFQSIGERLNSEVFDDAGLGMKLAASLNRFLLRAAKDRGIRAVTPGVRPEDRQMLVFEITPHGPPVENPEGPPGGNVVGTSPIGRCMETCKAAFDSCRAPPSVCQPSRNDCERRCGPN